MAGLEPQRGIPALSGVRLTEDGSVVVEGCAAVSGGRDAAEYARLLNQMLPQRAPGALRLAIARAVGGGELPSFASADDFFDIVQRFIEGEPRDIIGSLWREARRRSVASGAPEDISDVRRARRASKVPLAQIAELTSLPLAILRQIEWGDFREWRNSHWAARAASEYAEAAGLDVDRVTAIIERERQEQLGLLSNDSIRALPAAPPTPGRSRRWHWVAVAAALVVGGVGATLVPLGERRELMPSTLRRAALPPKQPADAPTVSVFQEQADEPDASMAAEERSEPPAREAVSEPPTREAARAEPMPAHPGARTAAESTRPVATPAVARAFSPSFSPADSAVFFHRDEHDGSVLMKAQRDDASGALRLMRIVDDGARNYHVRPSPDGSRIVFDSDRDGERGVYVARADGSGVQRVSGPGYAAVPTWSPDGHRLAYVRGEPGREQIWNVWIHDLRSNTVVRLTAHRYGQAWGGSWFPDGRRLVYSHEDRLVVVDLETGARQQFRSPVSKRLMRTPAVSPDGRYVAFQVHRDGGWLLDTRDGSMRRILDDPTAEEFAWDPEGHRLAFHSRRSGTWSVWVMAPAPS